MKIKLISTTLLLIAFSYAFSGEPGLSSKLLENKIDTIYPTNEKRFHKTRFEVLSNGKSFMQIGRYLKKYKRKRFNADGATVRYFDCQRTLLNERLLEYRNFNGVSLALVGDLMWIGKPSPNFVAENVLAHLAPLMWYSETLKRQLTNRDEFHPYFPIILNTTHIPHFLMHLTAQVPTEMYLALLH